MAPLGTVFYTTCADKVKDLNKRYRWDLLWLLKLDLTEIYKYANDSHIDTVLRKLVRPL